MQPRIREATLYRKADMMNMYQELKTEYVRKHEDVKKLSNIGLLEFSIICGRQ